MSIWTEYGQQTPKGTAGSLYDLTAHTVDSFRNDEEDGVLMPGMGVVIGENPGASIALPTEDATAEDFLGVAMYGGSNEMDMKGKLIVPQNYQVSVMRHGRVWVKLAEDAEVEYHDAAYLIIEGEEAGCFTNAPAEEGDPATIAVSARFIDSGSDGLAAIELYDQMNTAPAAPPAGEGD